MLGSWSQHLNTNFDVYWCSALSTDLAHTYTAMLYSTMLNMPRGKYCAELQAQCHVKTGPDHIRTGPDLDQIRTENNPE